GQGSRAVVGAAGAGCAPGSAPEGPAGTRARRASEDPPAAGAAEAATSGPPERTSPPWPRAAAYATAHGRPRQDVAQAPRAV
ncbi:hypothetical protein QM806_41225, partial [Rhodococcus sp. IEGM 1351]|nr:hypothetical protein [Rhodococcus sp. IEGM 1351]